MPMKYVLMDTNVAIRYFREENNDINNKIETALASKEVKLLITYYTWYELFSKTTNVTLIKEKLRKLWKYSSGFVPYTDHKNDFTENFQIDKWLTPPTFPILEFNQFIIRLKMDVLNRINVHVTDTIIASLYMVLLSDHLNNFNSGYLRIALKDYQQFVKNNQNELHDRILGKLNTSNFDDSFFVNVLYDEYNEYLGNYLLVKESVSDFKNRIRKISYSNMITKLREINNKTKQSGLQVIYSLDSKEDIISDIYSKFYRQNPNSKIFNECKKFVFNRNEVTGRAFKYNDYIDMSILLLSQNIPNAEVYYVTNDKDWAIFMSNLKTIGLKINVLDNI